MPTIVTTSAFDVTLPDGHVVSVPAGESDVSQEVAEHWFTVAHLVGTPKARMPVLQGENNPVEADEAGQRTVDPRLAIGMTFGQEPARQEGPVQWSKDSPIAQDAAKKAAEDAGTTTNDPVDGKEASRPKSAQPAPPPPPPPAPAPAPLPLAPKPAPTK